MTTYTVFRQLPPIPLPGNDWAANVEPAFTLEAHSAEDAIRQAKLRGIRHPVVERTI